MSREMVPGMPHEPLQKLKETQHGSAAGKDRIQDRVSQQLGVSGEKKKPKNTALRKPALATRKRLGG